jgi:uncharacterized protein YndB with AHSA1/START domain
MIERATSILPKDTPTIVTSRLLNAPRELVWKVLTTPEHLKHFWGPDGFTNTFAEYDLRVGGIARFTMHGPDGKDWPNQMTFTKVDPPHLLQFNHGSGAEVPGGYLFKNELRLTDEGGKTRLVMTLTLPSMADRDEKSKYAVEGGKQNLDRLAAYVAPMADEKLRFITERSFAVSQKRLFDACTKAEEMRQWFAAPGYTEIKSDQDFRAGGTYHYATASPQGHEMWGLVTYKEITPYSRLVYSQSFSDKDRTITRHPMAPTWPEEMHTVFEFIIVSPQQTLLRISWTYAGVDDAEATTFKAAHDGMRGGWKGTLDSLENYLAPA